MSTSKSSHSSEEEGNSLYTCVLSGLRPLGSREESAPLSNKVPYQFYSFLKWLFFFQWLLSAASHSSEKIHITFFRLHSLLLYPAKWKGHWERLKTRFDSQRNSQPMTRSSNLWSFWSSENYSGFPMMTLFELYLLLSPWASKTQNKSIKYILGRFGHWEMCSPGPDFMILLSFKTN